MADTDYYEILGVDRQADDKVLKSAYRKLAMQYHPDRNPGDQAAEAKFKEVSEAYDILKDPQKRAAYDRYGKAAFNGGGGGRSEEHTSELQSRENLVCRLRLEKNKTTASLQKPEHGLRRGELNGPPLSLPRRSNGRPREPAGRSAQVVAVRGSCRTCGLRGGGP